MLSIPLIKSPDSLLLKSDAWNFDPHALHRFIRTETHNHSSFTGPNIDSIINAYSFRHIKSLCLSSNTFSVLSALKTPSYRSLAIKKPTTLLNKLLRESNDYHITPDKFFQLPISVATRHLAVNLANHSPFLHHQHWFSHFDELHQLPTDEFLALLCATFIYESCIDKNSTEQDKQFLYQGICSAYINMQIAKSYNLHPPHNFMTPLMHFVSYLYIDREMHYQNELPLEHHLLSEIDNIHLKLCYWIAKDWGLSDPISHTLKERFQNNSTAFLEKEIMQKSEYAYLAIHLHQQRLLNYRQTESFLRSLDLSCYHFIEALNTAH